MDTETLCFLNFYFAYGSVCEVLWWARLSVYARSLPFFVPVAYGRARSSGRVTKSQGVRAFFGVFFPIDNALCLLSTAAWGWDCTLQVMSDIYDCLVSLAVQLNRFQFSFLHFVECYQLIWHVFSVMLLLTLRTRYYWFYQL